MESHLLISTHFTRVDGTIRPYRYFSNHDDKVVTLGPREVDDDRPFIVLAETKPS